MTTYREFLASRTHSGGSRGNADVDLNPRLMPFQDHLVRWAIDKGRGAIFADCGLGKTIIQLSWCEAIKKRSLVLTPLAVGQQTLAEAEKFNIYERAFEAGQNCMVGRR